jgi:AbrB family looped-hinge helix DNA binding protein
MPNTHESATSEVARLAPGGRLVIPARFRKSLGIKPGDELVMVLEEGELRILSRQEARKRAQDLVCRLVPKHVSLVDELIAERREEAARE